MKFDVIIAGVGGQGIISIATVLGQAALSCGLRVKQSEIHGMAQRGGAVHSHLRLSSSEIHSDVIPLGRADMILSMEPMEALRYLPHLSAQGAVVSNETPFVNVAVYPPLASILEELRRLPRLVLFNADQLAKENGSPRSVNMALLGAASSTIELPQEAIENAIKARFAGKGERIVGANLTVFRAAREYAMSCVHAKA